MKKILFPTDYSATANNAFKYALRLADSKKAELYVLHTYDPPIISGGISPSLVNKVIEKKNFQKLEQLEAKTPELIAMQKELGLEHVKVFFKIKEGLLLPSIEEAIKDNQIDFLVMGTNGLGKSSKLIGTNTLNAISYATVPVLSVPYEATYNENKTILFTSMFQEEEEATLDEFVKESENSGYNVQVLHIRKSHDDSCEAIYERWKQKYTGKPVTFHIFSSDNPAKALVEYINSQKDISIVATIRRNKSFFESILQKSTSQHIAKHIKLPLFIYKAK